MSKENVAQKPEKEDVDWLNDSRKSRDIVMEIRDFGVTQNQIKLIIGLLALELEDREAMVTIRECVDPDKNEDHEEENITILTPGGSENE